VGLVNGQKAAETLGTAAEPATDYQRGYRDGYAQCALEIQAAEHGIVAVLTAQADIERRRWRLRGEPRTRETFARPHPDDFTGRGAA
jgi:hypothetical protein